MRAEAGEAGGLPPLPPAARIQTLLFEAARLGRVDLLAGLVAAGAEPAARDANGHTALILAAYHGHGAAVMVLAAQGAPVDQPDGGRGNTALMGAVFKGHETVVHALLALGADVDARNHAGQTALMLAALFDRSGIADILLDAGADPTIRDIAGNDAVALAIGQGNQAMAARLLRADR
jgi:ankyrin repeat protein